MLQRTVGHLGNNPVNSSYMSSRQLVSPSLSIKRLRITPQLEQPSGGVPTAAKAGQPLILNKRPRVSPIPSTKRTRVFVQFEQTAPATPRLPGQ